MLLFGLFLFLIPGQYWTRNRLTNCYRMPKFDLLVGLVGFCDVRSKQLSGHGLFEIQHCATNIGNWLGQNWFKVFGYDAGRAIQRQSATCYRHYSWENWEQMAQQHSHATNITPTSTLEVQNGHNLLPEGVLPCCLIYFSPQKCCFYSPPASMQSNPKSPWNRPLLLLNEK